MENFVTQNNISYMRECVNTRFNRSVIVKDKENINTMVSNFQNVFNGIGTYIEEISSLMWFPINIPKGSAEGKVKSSHPEWASADVKGYTIDYDSNYFYIAHFNLTDYDNSYDNYPPYMKAKLYLPFLGFLDIDITPYIGRYLNIRMSVDYSSGKGMYYVGYSNDSISQTVPQGYDYTSPLQDPSADSNITFLSTFEFQCSVNIPLGASSWTDMHRNLILGTVKTVASIGVGIATGSMAASNAMSKAPTTRKSVEGFVTNKEGEKQRLRVSYYEPKQLKDYMRPEDKTRPVSDLFNGAVSTINNLSGGGSSDRSETTFLNGNLGINTTHLFLFKSKNITPYSDNYARLFGRPLGEVRKLESLKGYTEIATIHIEGDGFAHITESERQMIEKALNVGVII